MHGREVLCAHCRVPICRQCLQGMPLIAARGSNATPAHIPMELGQGLFWGYSTNLLVEHRVRWIDMAAVMPMWTHMLAYYVEGHQGHMMNEEASRQQWRCNVQGQCFSFVMPWTQLLEEFKRRQLVDKLLSLPRDEHVLQYLFRIHLKVAGESFAEDLKQVRLRPYVLILLLHWLWETRPDLFPKRTQASEMILDAITAKVHGLYPETETHLPEAERSGMVPNVFQEQLQPSHTEEGEAVVPPRRKSARFVPATKNATAGNDPAESMEEALRSNEPRCCIMDGETSAHVPESKAHAAALHGYLPEEAADAHPTSQDPDPYTTRTADLFLQTGFDMQEHWVGEYVSKALLCNPAADSRSNFLPHSAAD